MQEMDLQAEAISVKYGKRLILENISFQVRKGEFWGILGPNGSGKTTFLKALGGWLKCSTGDVLLSGENLKNIPRKMIAKKIGMVSVEEVNSSFSVEETVFMGRFSHLPRFGKIPKDDYDKVQEAMKKIGVYEKKDCSMMELSQGERQKVWVARALAQDVDILLLDEPTSHLDVKSQGEIFSLLESLCKEKKLAVVSILHDINLAIAFSTHLLLMKDGNIQVAGEKKEVLNVENLTDLYEVPFEINSTANGEMWTKICYKEGVK